MLTRSWPPRRRLALVSSSIAIILIFTAISRLQYPSSESVVGIRLPYYKGNDNNPSAEQEIRKQPFRDSEIEFTKSFD
jgi:hypothetical protein